MFSRFGKRNRCGLCGEPARGFAFLDGERLCFEYPGDGSCYETVHEFRPLAEPDHPALSITFPQDSQERKKPRD